MSVVRHYITSDQYGPVLSRGGVAPFIAEFVFNRYRPTDWEQARQQILRVMNLYTAGGVLVLPRLGLRFPDLLSDPILLAAFGADPEGIIDDPAPMLPDRRMTRLIEAAFGWRAEAASLSTGDPRRPGVLDLLVYIPNARVSERLAGNLLFDGSLPDLEAARGRAREIVRIHSDLSFWLRGHLVEEGREPARVDVLIRNEISVRVLTRAMNEGLLARFDQALARRLAVREIDESIAVLQRQMPSGGFQSGKGAAVYQQRLFAMRERLKGIPTEADGSGPARMPAEGKTARIHVEEELRAAGFGGIVVVDSEAVPVTPEILEAPDLAEGTDIFPQRLLDGSLSPFPVSPAPAATPVR